MNYKATTGLWLGQSIERRTKAWKLMFIQYGNNYFIVEFWFILFKWHSIQIQYSHTGQAGMQSSATLPDNAGFPHNASEIWDGTELIELLVSGVAYSLAHCWTVLLLIHVIFNPFVKRKSWKMIYDIFSILLLCSRRCDAIGLQLVIYKITPTKLLEWYRIASSMFILNSSSLKINLQSIKRL